MSSHWHIDTDGQGVLWLGLDYSCGSVNVLSSEVLTELDEHLGSIETDPPAGLVLHSLKARGFIAGAEVTELDGLTSIAPSPGWRPCPAPAWR
jgi:3-hydroxyacyl-CoA dehydrogenase/enoyl-CoA hydratase/3-hydroxybutyryl-CoA epimerase